LTDVTDGERTYEVLRDDAVDNHGLLGGTFDEIFVRDRETGSVRRLGLLECLTFEEAW
jgi:hypothetical protein